MRTNNQRKTVVTDSETGIAYRFSSITEARKFSGCTYYKITCCSDTGEKWEKYHFDILPADEPNDGAHLVAIEKDGTEKEYYSIRDFSEKHYISLPTVRYYLKKRNKNSVVLDVVIDVWKKGEKHEQKNHLE